MEYSKETLSILDTQTLKNHKSDFERQLQLNNRHGCGENTKLFYELIGMIDSILLERSA